MTDVRVTIAAVMLVAACGATKPVPAGPPRRPEPQAIEARAEEPSDCAATEPQDGPPAKAYRDRVVDLGQSQAEQGLRLLKESEERSLPVETRSARLAAAAEKFVDALAADPYNVPATYNLAAAYARIGRQQCALNLLARMVEMSTFPSQREAISAVADRLLGRGRWRGRPDPDFEDLRSDERFLNLVKLL